jgi:hypothetical protein
MNSIKQSLFIFVVTSSFSICFAGGDSNLELLPDLPFQNVLRFLSPSELQEMSCASKTIRGNMESYPSFPIINALSAIEKKIDSSKSSEEIKNILTGIRKATIACERGSCPDKESLKHLNHLLTRLLAHNESLIEEAGLDFSSDEWAYDVSDLRYSFFEVLRVVAESNVSDSNKLKILKKFQSKFSVISDTSLISRKGEILEAFAESPKMDRKLQGLLFEAITQSMQLGDLKLGDSWMWSARDHIRDSLVKYCRNRSISPAIQSELFDFITSHILSSIQLENEEKSDDPDLEDRYREYRASLYRALEELYSNPAVKEDMLSKALVFHNGGQLEMTPSLMESLASNPNSVNSSVIGSFLKVLDHLADPEAKLKVFSNFYQYPTYTISGGEVIDVTKQNHIPANLFHKTFETMQAVKDESLKEDVLKKIIDVSRRLKLDLNILQELNKQIKEVRNPFIKIELSAELKRSQSITFGTLNY